MRSAPRSISRVTFVAFLIGQALGVNEKGTSAALQTVFVLVATAALAIRPASCWAICPASCCARKLPAFPMRNWLALYVVLGAIFGSVSAFAWLTPEIPTDPASRSRPPSSSASTLGAAIAGVVISTAVRIAAGADPASGGGRARPLDRLLRARGPAVCADRAGGALRAAIRLRAGAGGRARHAGGDDPRRRHSSAGGACGCSRADIRRRRLSFACPATSPSARARNPRTRIPARPCSRPASSRRGSRPPASACAGTTACGRSPAARSGPSVTRSIGPWPLAAISSRSALPA